MPRSRHSRRKISTRAERDQALRNHEQRIAHLESKMSELVAIVNNQAKVIGEAVFATQLLINKGVITRDELLEIKKTLLNADQKVDEGSGVQSQDTGSNVDSGGSGESGLSGGESDRGDSERNDVEESGRDKLLLSQQSDQSNSDAPSGEG